MTGKNMVDLSKYLRVIPIFGLFFYYMGNLVLAMSVSSPEVYLLLMAALSVPLLVGLFMRNRVLVIVGCILALLQGAGPIASLVFNAAAGGLLVLTGDVLFVVTIVIWAKNAK
ncbi:MAG: hypothetical protein HXY34_06745 [Candidatus Thorarchaeota archaeon]|nr:hypothetical protein [Candidatus Thorarchaeota archaeon]